MVNSDSSTLQPAQVHLRSDGDRLVVSFPAETQEPGASAFSELLEQLKQRLVSGERFWQGGIRVDLVAPDRLLDARQLQAITQALENAELSLEKVFTNRRQTAVAAASAGYSVEQQSAFTSLKTSNQTTAIDSLYLETTVRSGMEINYPGSIIILGDVNPGGLIVASGDIVIWGKLRGIAHAGANGNQNCRIMALEMQPTQLRIADAVARAPDAPSHYYPEVAYITPEGIRISRANDFARLAMMG
jgi:septum site-determining protein MinC